MHSENWDDLRYVLAVAEGGSVSAAARALGVNHATVLRRVAAFEERHGVSLFEKGARGYSIPPDRIKVIEAAREVEAAMAAVDRLMRGDAAPVAGRVRVTSTDTFCSTVLPGILAAISTRGPGVELLTSNGHLDFARLHADITVRPTERLPDDLAGERAGTLGFAVYGRPGATGWLGLKGRLAGSVAGAWMVETIDPAEIVASSDSFPTLTRFAEAGLGRAVLPCVLGDASSSLERLPGWPDHLSVSIWVASHVDLADASRLRSVRAAIVKGLSEHADALSGAVR
jgi:DNA-binding transcriptional LysR family regulator